jgi:hypothetical protein
MVEHLVKVVPVNMVRFFRSEAIERWHLDPDRAESLDGRRDQLITFLQECCGFSTSCAAREVDDFLRALDEKIQQATQVAPRAIAAGAGQTPGSQTGRLTTRNQIL